MNIKDALSGKLPKDKLHAVCRSYDIFGDVAVVEIPDEVSGYEKEIADAIFRVHKNVNVVAKKIGPISGEFRVRPLKIVLCRRKHADCNTETMLKENGVKVKLDPSKVYYSTRLSTERSRVADLIPDGENVLLMFAGVGPFALVIAKRKRVNIVAIELNPVAFDYMQENIGINKNLLGNIKPILGDVRDVVLSKYIDWATYTIMPLPKSTHNYMDVAVLGTKNNGIIYTYAFLPEDDWEEHAKKWINEQEIMLNSNGMNVSFSFISAHKVRQYAPRILQVAILVRVDKTDKRKL